MWAGESKTVTCTVTDADTGASVNLTSCSITWKMLDKLGGTTYLTKAEDATGCAITISGCTFSFTLTNADTDALQGRYCHEAEVLDTNGSTFKPMSGMITIEQGAI
jgi:hypothetical protein